MIAEDSARIFLMSITVSNGIFEDRVIDICVNWVI